MIRCNALTNFNVMNLVKKYKPQIHDEYERNRLEVERYSFLLIVPYMKVLEYFIEE